jgi:hypothetical protein
MLVILTALTSGVLGFCFTGIYAPSFGWNYVGISSLIFFLIFLLIFEMGRKAIEE